MNNKTCLRCSQYLPLAFFSKRALAKDGLATWCKGCSNSYNREKYASEGAEARARRNQAMREWKRANRPRGEKFHLRLQGLRRCTRCSVVKASTPEFFIVVGGLPTSPCRECLSRERRAAYVPHPKVRGANVDPAKKAATKKRRKALERGAAISDFTAEQWLHLKMAFGQRCAYCHKKRPLTQDHVIPLVRGGNHTASNIVPACQSCNSRKSAKAAPDFQPALLFQNYERNMA